MRAACISEVLTKARVGQTGCVSLAQAPWHLFGKYVILAVARSTKFSGDDKMTGLTLAELDRRIAAVRQNISDLVEQAAAYSGASDESRAADRIAQQEQELARLTAQRDALKKR
jgi:uncharacterized small protein (DUF1192 family)